MMLSAFSGKCISIKWKTNLKHYCILYNNVMFVLLFYGCKANGTINKVNFFNIKSCAFFFKEKKTCNPNVNEQSIDKMYRQAMILHCGFPLSCYHFLNPHLYVYVLRSIDIENHIDFNSTIEHLLGYEFRFKL